MAQSIAAGVHGNAAVASSSSVNLPRKLSHLNSVIKLGTGFRCLTIRNQRLKSKPLPRRLHLVAAQHTPSTFEDMLENSDKLVVVDFFATWCGPCQFMVPILEKVGALMKEKVEIVKIDTQKNQSIANKYGIEALPTFILFKDGKQCDRFEGAMPQEKLIERIETSLKVT